MHSPGIAKLLNNTTNQIYQSLETKDQWYKIYLTTIPKTYFKKISYIKKNIENKQNNEENDVVIEFLAKNMKLSKREVENYINEFNIDIETLKEGLK